MEFTRDVGRSLKNLADVVALSRGVLDTEGLDEDVQTRFRCKDDRMVEVHRWINDVQWNVFRVTAIVCRDDEFGNEDMPIWTRKGIKII